ncbi:MAG: (2Fe-2S) ferredoxin domain-containing protein [Pleurocapsa sp. MO_192.B19]|nr:(2Fe-2S) ferredoxin domain-containing protein [Pleurocapsa sp. MO_192.B19]
MVALQPLVSEFTVVGKLEDLNIKSNGRIKYLLLSTEQEEYWIKVPKEQPLKLSQQLQLGAWVKVTGMRKREIHKGQVKYKAYSIQVLPTSIAKVPTVNTKVRVIFCQESTCWNKGGKAACQLLKAELEQRGISEQVEIKTSGCLKKCKQAPNMILLPDRVNYSRVQPQEMSELIDKHIS